jgi:hypothetical protein
MNIFEGISRNYIFMVIIGVIFALQILLVTFGSTAMGVYSNFGLNIYQWLMSVAIGMGSLIVGVLAKLIPENKMCLSMGSKSTDPMENK